MLPELRENAEIGGDGEAKAVGRGLTTQSFVHHGEGWVFIWRATEGSLGGVNHGWTLSDILLKCL